MGYLRKIYFSKVLLHTSALTLSFSPHAIVNEPNLQQQQLASNTMEVIAVYVQKRAQLIEDVSIVVSQVKGDTLKVQHYKDSTELSIFAPNFKKNTNHPLTSQLTVDYQLDQWAFILWGKNLLDTEYSHLKFDLTSFFGMFEDFKGEGHRRYKMDISFKLNCVSKG